MHKQLILLVLFVVVLSVGCTDLLSGRDNRFVGSWLYDDLSVTLFSNGTITQSIESIGYYSGGGTWNIRDNRLVVTTVEGEVSTFIYSFSADGNSLILTATNGGEPYTYSRTG